MLIDFNTAEEALAYAAAHPGVKFTPFFQTAKEAFKHLNIIKPVSSIPENPNEKVTFRVHEIYDTNLLEEEEDRYPGLKSVSIEEAKEILDGQEKN